MPRRRYGSGGSRMLGSHDLAGRRANSGRAIWYTTNLGTTAKHPYHRPFHPHPQGLLPESQTGLPPVTPPAASPTSPAHPPDRPPSEFSSATHLNDRKFRHAHKGKPAPVHQHGFGMGTPMTQNGLDRRKPIYGRSGSHGAPATRPRTPCLPSLVLLSSNLNTATLPEARTMCTRPPFGTKWNLLLLVIVQPFASSQCRRSRLV